MNAIERRGLATGFLVLVAFVPLFVGQHVPVCLGLITTAVGCAAATGILPGADTAMVNIGTCLALAITVLVWPGRSSRRLVSIAAVAAGACAVVGWTSYALNRPLTLVGPAWQDPFDPMHAGPDLVLALPFEPIAATAYAVLGASIAVLLAGLIARLPPLLGRVSWPPVEPTAGRT